MNALLSISWDVRGKAYFSAPTRELPSLPEQLVIIYNVSLRLKASLVNLFDFFDLYARFAYDFTVYVSALFARLIIGRFVSRDDRASAVHSVNLGRLRDIALSMGLFDDIERSLGAAPQLG